MDWENPLRSIAATVDADVLRVLAGAREPVTGNQLARVARRSYAQVYAVVGRMVDERLVLRTRYGRTNTYRFNRDHALAEGILRVLATPARIENEIRQEVQAWNPLPETVALHGPTARRRVAAGDPVDLFVVRPDQSARTSPAWRTQVAALTRKLELLSGNQVRLTEVDRTELEASASVETRTIFERRPAT
jgi:hypothetical protein